MLLCAVAVQSNSCSKDDDKKDDSGKEQGGGGGGKETPETTLVWQDIAETSSQSLINHFWSSKGFFNFLPDKADTSQYDWSYWPQAHAMDVVIDGYLRTNSNSYKSLFDKWYEGIKQKSGGSYYNNYYDDMEWICLTMIRLYEATGEQKYLSTAKDLWNDIKGGWNTQGGGGIAWKKDQTYSKNACSNCPAGIIAAKLYRIEGKAEDLEWAKRIYNWVYGALYDPDTGRVNDNLNATTGTVTNWCFTYNEGTMLGLAHELYGIEKESAYLRVATKIATATFGTLCVDDNTRLLKDEGTGDGGLFKGVFIRYFVKLALDPALTTSEKNNFAYLLSNHADKLWNKSGINKIDPLFGPDWSKTGTVDLGTQTSGCVLMEAMALYEKSTN